MKTESMHETSKQNISKLNLNERARKLKFFYVILVLVCLLVDQLTKFYFETNYELGERVNLFAFFDFILAHNNGAAFSMFSNAGGWQKYLFLGLAFGVSAWLIYMIRKNVLDKFACISMSLIIAGALGNAIDRIVYGYVVDFLLFYWDDWNFYYPAFNIADSCITIGVILLIFNEFFLSRKKREIDEAGK
ncbi:signal peptidase II [Taylorella equigenitalis]|uniref:Lipoprotein signal peptidase n=1 Tax=Taylorella equigenitalis 14/56 TaxID=1091497 RepID=I7IAT0_9BURK|nr:signal peptidase II [Taylorella equigenitalis]WED99952.1 signal peptidase II [Taylorella equigenitalis]WEE01429.1 signal peptidase II [Taylorella equigenitalis]WFD77966.1 signal peptidase II [Taylorella equigenitalis]WFD79444.1 signal peptidase II [Taylorella equigenitalis]WFD80920.1 signal peptidase II [Taylorella equigenitalis]